MQLSPAGLGFIASNEGFVDHVYDDAAGIPTIGYGHKLLPGESFPDGITPSQGQAMLFKDLALVQNALTLLVPSNCTQNQWDALCDFGYNAGVAALKTMLAHGWDQVTTQIPRWVYAKVDGVETVIPGLVTRRKAELTLFEQVNP